METDPERRALALDFVLAASNLFLFFMLSRTLVVDDGWWLAVAVALVSGGLIAAADRSQTGLWALVVAGILAMVAIVWIGFTASDLLFYMPRALLGLGVGMGLNRLVFGVIRPLPDLRRRRVSSR